MPNIDDQSDLLYEGGGGIENLRTYLLSILSAALITAFINKLMGEKGTLSALTKLIGGLFLTFTLIGPVANINLSGFTNWTQDYQRDAQKMVTEGQSQTKNALAQLISQRTQAYILDKAQALNTALEVEVTLSDDEIPIPVKVRLAGKVSPYAKGRLQAMLEEELGIEKENQIWT